MKVAAALASLAALSASRPPASVAAAFAPRSAAPAAASSSPLFTRRATLAPAVANGDVGAAAAVTDPPPAASVPDDGAPVAAPEADSESEGDGDSFDWFRSWYPVFPVDYLDPAKPHKVTLLGMDLVVWNDGPVDGSDFGPKKDRPKGARKVAGTWRVFADQCPHRKVPLSEGRVEDDGTLLCSYHAWRFDGCGDLIAAPQASEEGGELDRIKANPKSSCNAFPAKVVNGLLWVWADPGPDAVLESELTPVPIMPLPHEEDDSIEEERVITTPWNSRQLPYGHDFFLENVMDPAHVPASHHNIVGNRYSDTKPLKITTEESLTKDGFTIGVSQYADHGFPQNTHKYTAPCRVDIKTMIGDDGARQILELYSSPSMPGFCNHMGRQVIVKTKKGETPSALKQFLAPIPVWMLHLLGNTFLNQDALFLHAQERALHRTGQYSALDGAKDGYAGAVLPISADRGVLLFRDWLRKKAGGRIPYANDPPMPPVSNEVVFDIYNSHTKDCKYCSDALRRLRKVRKASYIAAAVVAVVRPGTLGTIGTSLVAGVLGGLGLLSNKVIKLMHRMEFSHTEND